jgi:aminotransferase
MKKKIANRVEKIEPSGIREFFDLVLGMKGIISLGIGEPDFVTPWHVREAGIYALEQGYTSYTSNQGLPQLRKLISQYLYKKFNLQYDPEEEILITVGVSEAYDLAIRALVNPGDEVLVPQPCYVSYYPVSILAEGKPKYISTSKSGFKLTPGLLESHISSRSKILVLNYPNNPTGVTYTKEELRSLAKIIKENNLIVISDEIYAELTYDHEHTSLASFPGMRSRTVYLNGFSKAFAMTGWRLGFACGPREIISAMNKIHQYTMLCASIISQMAGMEAMLKGDSAVHEMAMEYKRRRDYIVERLKELGLEFVYPGGAFYIYVNIKTTGLSGKEFAFRLLKEKKVAVVPGVAFGPEDDNRNYVRVAYTVDFDTLKKALNKIEEFLRSL